MALSPFQMEASGIVGRSGIIGQSLMTEVNTQEITRVIEDPREFMTLYQHLASSVKSEALLLLLSSLKLVRAHQLGIIDELVEASEKRGATVRILCPVDESTILYYSLFKVLRNELQFYPIRSTTFAPFSS
jgi:hypothetical protein